MKSRSLCRLAIMLSLVIGACSTSTRITGSWKDPAINPGTGQNKSVLLIAMTRNIEVRTKLENALAAKAAELNSRR